jgi:hypothetical protein
MVASAQLSKYYRLYTELNRRLDEHDVRRIDAPRDPSPPAPARCRTPSAARPRGFAAGSQPRKRFTDQQQSVIIDLLKIYPHSPSTVAKEFEKAAGVTVSTVTVFTIKRKAIKAGKLQPA